MSKPGAKNGAGVLEHIAPKALKDSPFNYRRTYPKEDIDGIASTAKDLGILETLMARPVGKDGKGRELVFGHKRKLAALQLRLATVPVLIRSMTDREVRLAQMVENSKRANAHPLEEADGLKALITEEGMAVADISAALARSPASVYRRLSLTHLCKKGRAEFLKGNLRTGVAELIARLGDMKAQAEAVSDLAGDWRGSGLATIKAARDHIEINYLRELDDAPFSTRRDDLIGDGRGACTHCPKRTGVNPSLFGDLQGKNVCTDGKCFGEKAQAAWAEKAKAHKAAGGVVLGKAETAEAFPYKGSALSHTSGFADLDGGAYYGEPSHAEILKKAKADLPPIVLARDPTGKVRRLVKTADMDKALKPIKGHGQSARTETPAQKKAKAQQDLKADIERRVGRLGAAAIVDRIQPGHKVKVEFWRMLATLAIDGAWHDTASAVCKRRGVEVPKGGDASTELAKHAAKLAKGKAPAEALVALVVEVLLKGTAGTDSPKWASVSKLLGIKRKDLVAAAKRERTEELKAKKAKAKTKRKKVKK